jgi:hypothetical protein
VPRHRRIVTICRDVALVVRSRRAPCDAGFIQQQITGGQQRGWQRVELTRVVSTMRIPPPGMTRVYGAVAFVFVDFRSRINEDSAMNLSGMFSRPLAGRGLS